MTGKKIPEALVDQLTAILPTGRIISSNNAYLTEPRGRFQGRSRFVLLPRTTNEVASIVRFCCDSKTPLVPFSGGTGLVGGQVKAEGDEAFVLSLEKMTKLRHIDTNDNTVIVEAGMILSDLQNHATQHDRLFPLSLASEGSCRIGGNLATNAGGVHVLRYGNARDLCLGLEAVLPDGSVFHGLKRLRKDNTGYDLRNLLIGSEGSLGVITAACLKLFAQPKEVVTGFVVVKDPAAALALLGQMQDQLDGLIAAFELVSSQSFEFVHETLPGIRPPFAEVPPWAVLFEVQAGPGSEMQRRSLDVLERALANGLISDAILSQNEAQRMSFWQFREAIPEANRLIGSIASHDISVPVSLVPEFIETGRQKIAVLGDFRLNCFGHLGDGNLHYNVYPPKGEHRSRHEGALASITRTIYDLVHAFGGSISAEHGIGRLKVDELTRYSDPAKIKSMKAIKKALDPKGIMNPGVIFPG